MADLKLLQCKAKLKCADGCQPSTLNGECVCSPSPKSNATCSRNLDSITILSATPNSFKFPASFRVLATALSHCDERGYCDHYCKIVSNNGTAVECSCASGYVLTGQRRCAASNAGQFRLYVAYESSKATDVATPFVDDDVTNLVHILLLNELNWLG